MRGGGISGVIRRVSINKKIQTENEKNSNKIPKQVDETKKTAKNQKIHLLILTEWSEYNSLICFLGYFLKQLNGFYPIFSGLGIPKKYSSENDLRGGNFEIPLPLHACIDPSSPFL